MTIKYDLTPKEAKLIDGFRKNQRGYKRGFVNGLQRAIDRIGILAQQDAHGEPEYVNVKQVINFILQTKDTN